MFMQHWRVIGFAIPLKGNKGEHSPLKHLEHALHPYVALNSANLRICKRRYLTGRYLNFKPYGHATSWYRYGSIGLVSRWYLPIQSGAVKTGVAKLPGRCQLP
ncbi:hypothetical protein OH492_18705 [Vibrio chagasii]|nr:hypothetical protein [Vibrio chagasii]